MEEILLLKGALIILIPLSLLRLILQGLRFFFLTRALSGKKLPIFQCIGIRASSEFVALSLPSYVGGEVIRIIYLKEKGLPFNFSSSIVLIEVMMDILPGYTLAFLAGILALIRGKTLIGSTILILTSLFTSLYLSILFLIKKRWVPKILIKFLPNFEGNFQINRKLLLPSIFSLILVLLSSFLLYYPSNLINKSLSFSDSMLAIYASLIMGSISIGGAGLTELGLYFYLKDVLNLNSWELVILWRIISYHLIVLVSGLILSLWAIRKIPIKNYFRKV